MFAHTEGSETEAPPGADGDEPDPRGPLRRCFVSHEVLPKDRLIRFVVGPDGTVVPDLAGRLPGRGLWLQASRDIVARAVSRRLFAKAARASVTAPDDLADRIERLLVGRCLDWIGLARRAGQAVSGFEKVRGWLSEGRVALIIEASDAARHGVAKLERQIAGLPVARCLTAAELGEAFGRDRAVHVALQTGRLAKALTTDAGRLAGFRDGIHSGDAG